MDQLFTNLALGFATAGTLDNLFYCFVGVVLGTLIGVLPGIGPLATIAMLLPATYKMSDPTSALIMLSGIYYGAQYGGSTTAILVNLPGESSSVVTTLDGYQMARKGRAGAALSIAAIGSFFAGTVATFLLAAFAPPLAEVAFKFGPAEYFSLMVLGLIAAVVLANGSIWKALSMVVLGLLLGMIGTDVNSGVARFSFDVPELTDGINFVVVAMGVFGLGEIIGNLENEAERSLTEIKNIISGYELRLSGRKKKAYEIREALTKATAEAQALREKSSMLATVTRLATRATRLWGAISRAISSMEIIRNKVMGIGPYPNRKQRALLCPAS